MHRTAARVAEIDSGSLRVVYKSDFIAPTESLRPDL
jgi:hypothetical protein